MTTVKFSDTNAGGQARYPGAAAYAAARLGFRVFPLGSGGTPAIEGWPERATADLSQISDWFTGEFSRCGYGIACGPDSGVWVLDIDVKHGVNGFGTLNRLFTERSNNLDELMRTFTVATPSGGAHLYFRWPGRGEPKPYNSTGATNALGPGLDVRAARGYVRGPGWGGYAVVPRAGVRRVEVWEAPRWLTALAATKPAREGSRGDTPTADGYVFDAELTLAALRRSAPGTRNAALNKAAYKMARSGEVRKDAAWYECHAVMLAIGAGDDERAQRRTFESGWNSGKAKREEQ